MHKREKENKGERKEGGYCPPLPPTVRPGTVALAPRWLPASGGGASHPKKRERRWSGGGYGGSGDGDCDDV